VISSGWLIENHQLVPLLHFIMQYFLLSFYQWIES